MTEDDLNWWLTLSGQLEWTLARTDAETAPHSYVVHPRTAGMAEDDYVRAAHVISYVRAARKFYNMTSIYLTDPDGRLKWWTMDKDLDKTNLIDPGHHQAVVRGAERARDLLRDPDSVRRRRHPV